MKNDNENVILPSATINTMGEMFNYDEQYAKEHGTYSKLKSFVTKNALSFFPLILGVLISLCIVMFTPESLMMPFFFLALAIFVASLILTIHLFKRNRWSFQNWYTAFAEEDDVLWRVEPQKVYKYNTNITMASGDAITDRDEVAKMIDKVGKNAKIKLPGSYPKPKVTAMKDVKIVKSGKIMKCTYRTLKGNKKSIKIADAYPGLVDFINKSK